MRLDAHQCPEVLKSSRLHPSGRRSNVSGRSSVFNKKSDFLLRHRYGKTTASVWTIGQHRLDVILDKARRGEELQPFRRNRYYGIFVQQKCNHLNARATSSGCGPDMALREARYGKPVAQLSVRTASACVRTPPRENRISVNLGLL
jgi:hypothetical protein